MRRALDGRFGRYLPRPQETLADRLLSLRRRWRLLLRLSVSTTLAYAISTHLLGHQQAFFAPISAVIVITAGAGLRGRTLYELVAGVALGVLVGELLILTIGRGTWQMALVVGLTVVLATLVGIKGLALTQAASSSVLLAAVLPAAGAGNPAVTRFLDALVGGLCGLLLVLLLPRNPLRDIDREVQSLLERLSIALGDVALALREQEFEHAERALATARGMTGLIGTVEATAANVAEIARMSPMRWRQRQRVEQYVRSVQNFDNAVRDTRVLARRTSAMLRHHEVPPEDFALAVESMAEAVRIFADDLAQDEQFDHARQRLVDAARIAVTSLPTAMTLNSAAIAAQVRSLAADLLYASGFTRDEIDERLDFD
ncbi:MAG: FUSC family protein [Aeromicrobium erythreum]